MKAKKYITIIIAITAIFVNATVLLTFSVESVMSAVPTETAGQRYVKELGFNVEW